MALFQIMMRAMVWELNLLAVGLGFAGLDILPAPKAAADNYV